MNPLEPELTYPAIDPDELVFGLAYGAGAEADSFERTLCEALRGYGYELRAIRLSDYLPTLLRQDDFSRDTPDGTRRLQDMGDDLREITGANDALAQLGVYLMTTERRRVSTDGRRVAWLVRSLKRTDEVDTLRMLYGSRFVVFGLHVPEVDRRQNLIHRRQRWANVTSASFEEEATQDLRRDEQDRTRDHGQAVRDTFARADFFVDGRGKQALHDSLHHAVHLIFGEPFEPPHRDEQAMYYAFTAGLRSAEMGRQVGAAIVKSTRRSACGGHQRCPISGRRSLLVPRRARQPGLRSGAGPGCQHALAASGGSGTACAHARIGVAGAEPSDRGRWGIRHR